MVLFANNEATPALCPNNISKETLLKLNKEQKQNSELERDSIFVMEKILDKKSIDGTLKYQIKWENYTQTTWEPADNIPLIFRNYFDKTGNQKVLQSRIKHTKKIGNTLYHLLSWDEENLYWEREEAFEIEGLATQEDDSHGGNNFKCQTQKVCGSFSQQLFILF